MILPLKEGNWVTCKKTNRDSLFSFTKGKNYQIWYCDYWGHDGNIISIGVIDNTELSKQDIPRAQHMKFTFYLVENEKLLIQRRGNLSRFEPRFDEFFYFLDESRRKKLEKIRE